VHAKLRDSAKRAAAVARRPTGSSAPAEDFIIVVVGDHRHPACAHELAELRSVERIDVDEQIRQARGAVPCQQRVTGQARGLKRTINRPLRALEHRL
jgi:hypothetical protein